MTDDEAMSALQAHWAASDANDFDTEHRIYGADAVLEYPQSGERIRGRDHIQASRTAQPNAKRFTVRRIVRGWRPLDQRTRPHLRRSAQLRGEHHGVRRRPGRPRDAVLRRRFRAWSIARPVGRANGLTGSNPSTALWHLLESRLPGVDNRIESDASLKAGDLVDGALGKRGDIEVLADACRRHR